MNIDERSRRRLPAVEERYMTVAIDELPSAGMIVPGVAWLGDAQRATKTGLSLLFLTAGITVQDTEPPGETLLAWSDLDSVSCDHEVLLTDGRAAAVLEIRSGDQSIQFLLPNDTVAPGQVAYLRQALPAWLDRYRGPAPADVPPVPTRWDAPQASSSNSAWEGAVPGGTAAVAGASVVAGNGLATGNGHPTGNGLAAGNGNAPRVTPMPPAPAAQPAQPPLSAPPAPAPVIAPPAVPATWAPPAATPPAPTAWVQIPPPRPATPATDPGVVPPVTTQQAPLLGRPPTYSGSAGAPALSTPVAPTAWSDLPATVPLIAAPRPTPRVAPESEPAPMAVTAGVPVPPATGTEWVVPAEAVPAPEQVNERSGEPEAPRRAGRTWRVAVIALVVILVALIGGAVYLITRPTHGPSTTASPATIALAKSINVRISDLPAGWIATPAAAPVAPSSPLIHYQAERSLATCIGQPLAAVKGWLGGAAFPGAVVTATSPTFQSGAAPIVRIFSTTTVLASASEAQSLAAFFDAPNFGQCFGQYQAAAVVAPATAQVQPVPLTAPAGVKAHGYLTTFTLADHSSVVVGEAFIVGGTTVTVLSPSSDGPSIPASDFAPAFSAVAGRVSRASGQ